MKKGVERTAVQSGQSCERAASAVNKINLLGRDDTRIDFAARRFVRIRIVAGGEKGLAAIVRVGKTEGVDARSGKG